MHFADGRFDLLSSGEAVAVSTKISTASDAQDDCGVYSIERIVAIGKLYVEQSLLPVQSHRAWQNCIGRSGPLERGDGVDFHKGVLGKPRSLYSGAGGRR
jgi:hypothetical protein